MFGVICLLTLFIKKKNYEKGKSRIEHKIFNINLASNVRDHTKFLQITSTNVTIKHTENRKLYLVNYYVFDIAMHVFVIIC